MNRSANLRLFSVALLLALLFAAALPVAAFADEGEPPPAPTETAPAADEGDGSGEQPSDGEAGLGEGGSPPSDEPIVPADENSVLVTEDAPVDEATDSEPDAEAATVAEGEESPLADIPAGTEVVVLDEAGNPVPLASAEAAEILLDGDPQWCPVGVTPNSPSCTPQRATFALVLADLTAIYGAVGPAQNGVIWVRDTYAGADAVAISINGGTLTTMKNYTLTIKGGWTGVGTTINTGTPSAFDVALSIINWNADVTLSDITIDAGNVTGLTVTTTKNINLTRVSSNNNTGGAAGRGASLNNTGGTGNVTVTGGTFNGNAGLGGLRVFSNGNITLSGVTASSNTGASFGAQLDNSSGTGNISVTNSTFSNNVNSDGLIVGSKGTITLTSVTANSNTGNGASLTNDTAGTAKNVTLTGTNVFNSNSSSGLTVSSKGTISLAGVTAQSNDSGANLSNTAGTMGITVSNSNFSFNTVSNGLDVFSNGVITLSSVVSTSNTSGYGAFLMNTSGTGAVNVTNSTFNTNGGGFGGIWVLSKGTITLNNVIAAGNSYTGAELDNTASATGSSNISVTNSAFSFNFGGAGLYVYSNGTITLSGVVAETNLTFGAYLDNDGAPSAKAVTIAGINNQFDSNGSTGLNILTKGAITISNLTAYSNGNHGANLDADAGTGAVTVTNGIFSLNTGNDALNISALGNITLTTVTANQNTFAGASLTNSAGTGNVIVTTGVFNLNGGVGGINAFSKGTITLTNVTTNGNTGGYGVSLDNSSASTVKAVAVNGTNEFSSNRNNGLQISATGAITVSNVTANYNGITGSSGSGTWLNNTFLSSAVGVTLTGTNIFAGNYTNGLEIGTFGFIKLNSVSAISNSHGYGATLSNAGASPAQPVTITGTNLFKFNRDGGLSVFSNGLITASNLTANSNGPTVTASGVYLDNDSPGNMAGVTITGINVFNNNAYIGLDVQSRGAISVSSVTANENGLISSAEGVRLDNQNAATHLGVTLSGTNMFDGNEWAGLFITTHGAITVNSVTSINSVASFGVSLDNTAGGFTTANMAVNLTGTNVISNNYSIGLDVKSYGAITINNVTANDNGAGGVGGTGVQLYNLMASAPRAVTANGVNTTNLNDSSGFYVTTKGPIKVNSLTSIGNGSGLADYGAVLSNNTGTSANSITLTGTNVFNNNYTGGLQALATGAIALNSVTASGNLASHGLEATNVYLGTAFPQNVTLTGTNVFNNNYSSGVEVLTYGAISANSITANGNGTSAAYGFGVYLNNLGADPLVLPLKGVTVSGTNQFIDNYDSGLVIITLGAITGNNISASSNGGGSDAGVYLENYTAPSPMDVKLTGVNVSSSNSGNGFSIWTDGAVTLNSVTATSNGTGGSGHGLLIQNYFTAGKKVTLTGTNNFISNDDYGLFVSSSGVISVSNVTASYNVNGTGTLLDNFSFSPIAAQAVTMSGVNIFNNNGLSGLTVFSYGAVSISSVTANGNNDYGTQIINSTGLPPQAVTLTGLNKFDSNDRGLFVVTKGVVTSTGGISASNNTLTFGAEIFNDSGDGTGVTLNGSNTFTGNQTDGLIVISEGAITLNAVTATGNGIGASNGLGVQLDNDNDPAHLSNITISGVNNFSGNYSGGLLANSRGIITLGSTTASSNTNGPGLELDNELTEAKAITLSGTYALNENAYEGMLLTSHGAVTLNNITANGNGTLVAANGVLVDNGNAAAPQLVKLTGTNTFNDNSYRGLEIFSKGAITTNNITANENTDTGAYFNNSVFSASGGITMTGVNTFLGNGGVGLYTATDGSISLTKITSDGNVGDGFFAVADGNLTITCGSLNGNDDDGLDISILGTLTLKGIVSSGSTNLDYNLSYGSLVTVRTC